MVAGTLLYCGLTGIFLGVVYMLGWWAGAAHERRRMGHAAWAAREYLDDGMVTDCRQSLDGMMRYGGVLRG